MRISTHLLPEDTAVFLALVRKAEEVGLAGVWIQDSQMLWHDVYVYSTLGLSTTSRLDFGVAVANPITRHYTVTAAAAATLADLFPGRFTLGIGRGDSSVRTIGIRPVTTRTLEDTVLRVRALVAGESVEIGDKSCRIMWAGRHRVPLMMAASGPRSLTLAGRLADVVMMQVGVNPVAVQWAIDHVRSGARSSAREHDAPRIAVACALNLSDDLSEARNACRWSVPATANHLTDVVKNNPDHGMPYPLMRLVEARRKHYDYYGGHLDSSADHADYATDELIDDFGIAGPAKTCIERVRELERLGVDEIAFGYLNGDLDQLEQIGRELVPAVNDLASPPQRRRPAR
jgi:alkanesulfonate monooxygenase SsuD/methylene tetrahydromethanopterin reductase-like flavin-dependent oxidoreductase (luciferase family)